VLRDGKIEQIGSPHEVYESPKSLFAAQFMGPINIVKTSAGMVGIRPEKIMLYSSKPSLNADFDGCSVEGIVRDHIYLGGSTQYTVNLVDGSNVKVIQQNTQKISRNIFSIGNRVTLVWPKYAEQRLQ
jgi:ABC-type Fe3+/spermidine/putrescine transport system ATPase subunit